MAYASNESGQLEVYVQPYPGPGEKIRISTHFGHEPIWTRNGREILYRSNSRDGERHFYSVAVQLPNHGTVVLAMLVAAALLARPPPRAYDGQTARSTFANASGSKPLPEMARLEARRSWVSSE